MSRPRKPTPSRDDWRAVHKAKRHRSGRKVDVDLDTESRRRLNWLMNRHFRCDDYSMAVDLLCLRITGSLEPWKDGP